MLSTGELLEADPDTGQADGGSAKIFCPGSKEEEGEDSHEVGRTTAALW